MLKHQSLAVLLVVAGAGLVASACSSDNGNTYDTLAFGSATADSAAGSTAPPTPTGSTTLEVATTGEYSPYLTDADGRALYLFEADKPDSSTCADACASDWPPYTAAEMPMAGDSTVQASMVATITRPDGRRQVTYNHMPLYYYAKDTGPGMTNGQDVEEYGAEWYLVAPDGKKQEGKD